MYAAVRVHTVQARLISTPGRDTVPNPLIPYPTHMYLPTVWVLKMHLALHFIYRLGARRRSTYLSTHIRRYHTYLRQRAMRTVGGNPFASL